MPITKEVILGTLKDVESLAKDAVEKLKNARGIIAIAPALFEIVPNVVEYVEKAAPDLNLKGADKKKLAVDILNALIPWPWWIPASLRIAILEGAVDMAVAIFNRIWKKKSA